MSYPFTLFRFSLHYLYIIISVNTHVYAYIYKHKYCSPPVIRNISLLSYIKWGWEFAVLWSDRPVLVFRITSYCFPFVHISLRAIILIGLLAKEKKCFIVHNESSKFPPINRIIPGCRSLYEQVRMSLFGFHHWCLHIIHNCTYTHFFLHAQYTNTDKNMHLNGICAANVVTCWAFIRNLFTISCKQQVMRKVTFGRNI